MKRKLLREIPKCHHRWICTNVYDDGVVTVQRRQTRRERPAERQTDMSKYTVETRDGERTYGHQHKTAEAAERCRLRICDDARFYGAEVRKDGQRTDGTGHWADGEGRP